ncbi:PREDICTED: uncharacterized protein LOC105555740 [Vollenhovia emeryi]|uniref:uncharacterized protein LOC105555740 n=1 Tax=Vollenhovia emeryi TaxID=411798 RepID=UPI0005F43625|nr:PREDICTED: uncharacterized protein LOC105555740 [Vollenhovia emeryi]
MEQGVMKQLDLHGRIGRTCDNLKKTGQANITRAHIATALKLLEDKWTRFESGHDALLSNHAAALADHEYLTSDVSSEVENTYVHQRALLLAWEASLPALGETKKLPSDSAANKTTLPRIQLPTFSGKYEEWPSFRDLFTSIISRDASLSEVEKLHYLKGCLKGEAELHVRALPTIDKNFSRAWSALQGFYENKRIMVRSVFATFTSFSKMKGESATELRKLYHCVVNTVGTLEGIGRPINKSEDLFVFLASELLDPKSRREWEGSLNDNTDPPSFDEWHPFGHVNIDHSPD